MKSTNLTYKLRGFNHLVITLFLLLSSLTGAYAACCTDHGGVISCNKATGQQMCKDGTASPTCTCTIPKTTTKSKTIKTPLPAPGSKSNSYNSVITKGCCSSHGGVAHCNKSKGHQMCKDGTASPACTCH